MTDTTMPRRTVMGAGAAMFALGGRPAFGQAAPSAVVLPVPVPCADRPGDLVGLILEGPSEDTVVVFAQAFRAGDLPGNAGLGARVAGRDGRAMPCQMDVLARHVDGSVKHALVSLSAPRLGSGARQGVILSRITDIGAPPPDLTAALSGRSALLEIRPLAGGPPWQADLLALWRAAAGRPWQAGPLAVQGRVTAPVPPAAAGGVASLRLVADLSVRGDGTLWADVWLRNDIAMRPDGGEASYAMRLLLDGREVLAAEVPRHSQYRGWGRIRGSRAGGRPAPVAPMVRHDAAYLAATGAVLPYDLTTGVLEANFEAMARMLRDPAWEEPFHPRGIRQDMGAPGGRPDLGATTMWIAAWLVTGDRRAAAVALGQAEMAATIPWHYWDPGGGRDGSGGWLDVRRWPRFWTDPRGGRPPLSLLQPQPPREHTGWAPQASHQPALSYVPYLMTGRRGFLDNHMAQAAWNIVSLWPFLRQASGEGIGAFRATPPPAVEGAEDVILAVGQVRGAAWALRTVGEAAWIAPDADPGRDYFQHVERANWAWVRGQTPTWTRIQGELHGYIVPRGLDRSDHMTLFQHEYFCLVAAIAAQRGQPDARAVCDWMRNFIVGRFFAEERGFRRIDAIAYEVAIAPSPPPRWNEPPVLPYRSWAEVGRNSLARNFGNDAGWRASNGEYGRLALLSLAMTHNVLEDPRALEAYDWLVRSGAPLIRVDDFARVPEHNVTPRNRPRVPARAARVQSC